MTNNILMNPGLWFYFNIWQLNWNLVGIRWTDVMNNWEVACIYVNHDFSACTCPLHTFKGEIRIIRRGRLIHIASFDLSLLSPTDL